MSQMQRATTLTNPITKQPGISSRPRGSLVACSSETTAFPGSSQFQEATKMKKSHGVLKFPKCDICQREAHYDSKTIYGAWAYLCEKCNGEIGMAPDSHFCTTLILQEAK